MTVTNKDIMTSDGYFKDPKTLKDFTGQEERVKVNLKTGKEYKVPYIKDSDGNPIPLAYRLWTAEEKKAARDARGSGTSRKSASEKDEELNKKLDEFEVFLKEKLSAQDFLAAQDKLRVFRPKTKIDKMVDKLSDEEKEYLRTILK